MNQESFVKKNYRFLNHLLYILIWLFLVLLAHLIFYGGGCALQTILVNHGWWVFDNLNLPIDQAIIKWGTPALGFFNYVASLYDLIMIIFSVLIYVLLGRKYFTYWAKTFILMHMISFVIFLLFPVYYTPPDNMNIFINKTYYFSNFGELPSFHNLNIQIFIVIIVLAKIKKEKYERQINILIYMALIILCFLGISTFIGRIVSKVHYFIDGFVSLGMCMIVCFCFIKCQFMWADAFKQIRKKILVSKFSLLIVTLLMVLTLAGFLTHAGLEWSMGQ